MNPEKREECKVVIFKRLLYSIGGGERKACPRKGGR